MVFEIYPGVYSQTLYLAASTNFFFAKKIQLSISLTFAKIFDILLPFVAFPGTKQGVINIGCDQNTIEGEYIIEFIKTEENSIINYS